jgi:ABC-type transporter Mla maintaining outer membrane lipid asymmetry ATPase subunit MlaF
VPDAPSAATSGDVLVSLQGVHKDYSALRPLRIRELHLLRGRATALLGVDAAAAEVLVNLVTATSLPDEGEVRVFGRATAEVTDSDTWIGLLDHFGILSERAVLVEPLTVGQNLTMPFSLDVDAPSVDLRDKVAALAADVELDAAALAQRVGEASRAVRARVRLGRALALGPTVLLAEHPNALVETEDTAALAATLKRLVAARDLACVVITADRAFASAVTDHVLELHPATGELRPPSLLRKLLGR